MGRQHGQAGAYARFALALALMMALLTLVGNPALAENLGTRTLAKGSRGSDVVRLQETMKFLGYYSGPIDGVFGEGTRQAVMRFQEAMGLKDDGVFGPASYERLQYVRAVYDAGAARQRALASRGSAAAREGTAVPPQLVHWNEAKEVFERHVEATIIDLETRRSFVVVRTGGTLHADCEPASFKDTAAMKAIFGGRWTWCRRAVIVEVRGRRIAASINGMPHGYDTIDNGFAGHFCVHFFGSRLHNRGIADPVHQAMVLKSAVRGG